MQKAELIRKEENMFCHHIVLFKGTKGAKHHINRGQRRKHKQTVRKNHRALINLNKKTTMWTEKHILNHTENTNFSIKIQVIEGLKEMIKILHPKNCINYHRHIYTPHVYH